MKYLLLLLLLFSCSTFECQEKTDYLKLKNWDSSFPSVDGNSFYGFVIYARSSCLYTRIFKKGDEYPKDYSFKCFELCGFWMGEFFNFESYCLSKKEKALERAKCYMIKRIKELDRNEK